MSALKSKTDIVLSPTWSRHFPGEIQSLSVSKPTLEDVFIHRTGHRFWNEEAEAAAETGKKKKAKKH